MYTCTYFTQAWVYNTTIPIFGYIATTSISTLVQQKSILGNTLHTIVKRYNHIITYIYIFILFSEIKKILLNMHILL